MRRTVLPLLLLLGGCAAQPGADTAATISPKQAAELADALKALTPGEPQTCIDQTRVQNVQKFPGTILYKYSPREIYRNDVSAGCHGLRFDDIIVSRTISGQLCRGDIIRTVAPGGPGPTGSCVLGSFIPYRR